MNHTRALSIETLLVMLSLQSRQLTYDAKITLKHS